VTNTCSYNMWGIFLEKANNNSISNNTCSYNSKYGILLGHSNSSGISNNTCSYNSVGIPLFYSNSNSISNNVCSANNNTGIFLADSSNNIIYRNNFIDNADNIYSSYASINIWNSPLEITYTYDGTTYKSYLGNYWDDYEGTDAEGDGIGDTSYNIDTKKDESDDYPLMTPFENYILATSAPA
jgi:parallel beta-helix repeat protein